MDASREWDVRDATLRWLGTEFEAGNRDLGDISRYARTIQEAAGWSSDAIEPHELVLATMHLKSEGLIVGDGSWGHGVLNPVLTERGYELARSGRSLRLLPPNAGALAEREQQNVHITNHGPAQVAVHSSGFTQNMTVGLTEQKLVDLVALLRQYSEQEPANADEVNWIADEIENASGDPEANQGVLRMLLTRAKNVVMTHLIPELSDQIFTAASDRLLEITA